MRTKLKTRIMTLGAIGVVGVVGVGIDINNVGALSYQKNVDVGFKLEPSVSIKLSSSELTISDLAPGQSADSNIITLKVESNNANGYTVGSTVGGTKNETTYSNSNLQHSSNYDSTKSISYFQSLSTSDEVADLADLTAGKWGYSFNLNNGSWSSYSGLPFNDGETASAELVNVGTNAESSIQFKIAAAAQDQQYAGEYNNIVNFIAVVNPASQDKDISNAEYMQEVTTCPDTLTTDQVYSLKDSRDDQSYNVARLADGNCWMLDNLALDLTNSDILGSLSSSNTNINKDNESAILTSLKSGNRSAGTNYATAGLVDWTSGNSYSQPMVNLTNKDTVPQGDDPMASTVLEGGWKTGGFYNYCAASAGSYCYGDGTSQGTSSGSATSSICPAGWHMPTGNTTGKFYALATAITGTAGDQTGDNYTNFRTAFHYPLPGYFYNGTTSSQGSNGRFWSSKRYYNDNMYGLYANTRTVYPADYNVRSCGYSLRCILDN